MNINAYLALLPANKSDFVLPDVLCSPQPFIVALPKNK